MPAEDIVSAQEIFLAQGGLFVQALKTKRSRGEIRKPNDGDFYEYPKMLRISEGVQKFERSTETVDKRLKTWTDEYEVFREVVVHSEDEEERVLSGGKTTAAAEEERQALVHRARAFGIKVDPSWTSLRLRRELGDKLDAPEPPDQMGALEAQLSNLRKMAEMRAEIERLTAQLSKPADDLDELRSELEAFGIEVDRRWSARTLRQKLEEATAPETTA